MTAAKRAMSILLSAAMLMGNLCSPMTAFAGEAATEGNEVYEAPVKEDKPEQPATEAPDYLVTVPYYTEAAFMVDEGHVKKRADQGDTAAKTLGACSASAEVIMPPLDCPQA